MLAPPPDRASLDKGALDGEGREKYLRSLENKLNRLQGSNKRLITSKDIMSSLSDARDDHLRAVDHHNSSVDDNNLGGRGGREGERESAIASNDPWCSSSSKPTATMTREETNKLVFHHNSDDDEEGAMRDEGWLGCLLAACVCSNKQKSTEVIQRSRLESSLTAEEEEDYLMDCDQLGLSWNNNKSLQTNDANESSL